MGVWAQVRAIPSDFSELLQKMNEPSVSELATDSTAEVYRVIYREDKGIDGRVAVRVELNRNGTAEVITKWLAGAGKKLESRSGLISTEEFRSLRELIEQTSFWLEQQEPLVAMKHGDTWILEAVKDGRYHKLTVQLPESPNVARVIGERLLALGKSPFIPQK